MDPIQCNVTFDSNFALNRISNLSGQEHCSTYYWLVLLVFLEESSKAKSLVATPLSILKIDIQGLNPSSWLQLSKFKSKDKRNI